GISSKNGAFKSRFECERRSALEHDDGIAGQSVESRPRRILQLDTQKRSRAEELIAFYSGYHVLHRQPKEIDDRGRALVEGDERSTLLHEFAQGAGSGGVDAAGVFTGHDPCFVTVDELILRHIGKNDGV